MADSSRKYPASRAVVIAVAALLVTGIDGTAAYAIEPREPWTTSRVKGTPEPPDAYQVRSVFPGVQFDFPTSLEMLQGTGRLLVTEIGGKIWSFKKTSTVQRRDLVLDLVGILPVKPGDQELKLFSAAVHPNFRENHFMYVCYTCPTDGLHTRVSRFTLTETDPPLALPATEQIIIQWPAGGHNGGCLRFGKDGLLYISTGDGTGPYPPDGLTTGQDVSDLLGAVLRIDIDRIDGDQPYTVPVDNPFVAMPGARPEIWAYGLRNPWKFGIDPLTNDVFVADNGWESWEMVHHVRSGSNCGWPVMEGRVSLRSEVKTGPTPIIPPVKDHPHTEANSVIGGPVYRGKRVPNLQGSFVYGDYITGTIWSVNADRDGTYRHQTLVDTDLRIVAFGEGDGGEIYVVDYDFTGQIYELIPSGRKDMSADFPRRLSQTGLFRSMEPVTPASGVVPYQLRVDRWLDGAQAQRWIAIPDSETADIRRSQQGFSIFPDGTVLVKHLRLPQTSGSFLNLETQILHLDQGQWNPYSYLWDESGMDAQLIDSVGANRPLLLSADEKISVEKTWHVGARNECRMCHNAGSHFVLGFVPDQLDRNVQIAGMTKKQMDYLADQRIITTTESVGTDKAVSLVDPHDSTQSINDRARSYLHVNCSMCHHPRGSAIVSFYLRRDLPFDDLNTNKGTGIGTFGMRNARIIVPGDPYRSVLMYRMSKLGYARMPYIGSQVVDSKAVALIDQWIRSLSADNGESNSNPLIEGSKEALGLATLMTSDARDKRNMAIEDLLQSTEGTLALASRIHSGSLMHQDLDSVIARSKTSGRDIRGLIDTFVPEADRRKTLGPRISPDSILALEGNPVRGQLIYFSDAGRCRACHEVDPDKDSLGPNLLEINKKYPRLSEFIQHVIQPSLKIDDKLASYTVVTVEGQILSGLIVKRTDMELIIKTAEKKLIRIKKEQVEEVQKSSRSMMPEHLLSDLTAQEAADLIAYIRSLGASQP